ncbi:MAG TPA: sodium:proton antiporter [Bacteroidia bacterium]|nr:sodium:proton antiporter [Bacteroidia bacterium]
MNLYITLSILITISAAFANINHRLIKMPFVIGLFFLSTILSLIILISKSWHKENYDYIKTVIEHTDISKYILEIMLGFLLFAGSLHTNWAGLKKQIKPIGLFALGGVLLSTIIVAMMFYGVCNLFNQPVSFIYCLIFGAIISPTDPIAVIGILTKAKVSHKIESTIVGESLFNDGVGVVVFIALLETLSIGTGEIDFGAFGLLFIQEALGGVFAGLLLGYILHKLLKSIDNYEIEVLLTIAFVMSGYSLCNHFHLSGALAMVLMGLFVGNYKQNDAMSDVTIEYVHKFWELFDVILNAILFMMIAFVLVVIDFKTTYIIVSLISIFIVLLSRFIIVYLPKFLLPKFTVINNKEAKIIVWGGLRGGLSIALVLSLPTGEAKELLTIATYFCVVFSILIQGLTIGKLARM